MAPIQISSAHLATSVNNLGKRDDVSRTGSAFTSANTETWNYNAKGEVVTANSSTNDSFDRAFEFDGIDNRKKSAEGLDLTASTATSYNTNALNQYSQITNAQISNRLHDADGNLTDDGAKLFVWDAENRLIEIKLKSDDSTVATYAYDYQSRKITKTGGLLSVNDGSATYYPTFDGNGNVSEYVDATGNVVAHYGYHAFGKVVASGSKKDDFTPQFSTKQLDFESGFHYYGYRYYDSSNGRWPNRDPITEKGGVNLYGFVGNNGVNECDKLGYHALDDCETGYDDYIANCPLVWQGGVSVGPSGDCVSKCTKIRTECRAKQTSGITPLPSNSKECCRYKDSDEYANTKAKCFCKCAGDSNWSNYVRGCLRRMYDGGADPHNAHIACYEAASNLGYDRPEATLAACFVKCFDYNPFN